MTQPYPLPREIRESAVLAGNGGTGYGPFGFKIFDVEDVAVWLRPTGSNIFAPAAVTVVKTSDAAFDTFSIIFAAPVSALDRFVVQGKRLHERQLAVTRAGAISAVDTERELSKQGSVLDELRRDVDRAVRLAPGAAGNGQLPVLGEAQTMIWDATALRFVPGPFAGDVADAQANAAAAAASLTAFQRDYLGRYAAAPVLTPGGEAIGAGAFYWNTVSEAFFYWDGASWQGFPFVAPADGAVTTAKLDDGAVSEAKLDATVGALVALSQKRAVPAKFAALATFGLNEVYDCVGPGLALHNIDIEAIWDEKYGSALSGGTDLWVNWSTGNDSTGTGSFHAPYKTVKKAMASTPDTCRRIFMAGPYSEEVPSWTAADGAIAGGTLARAVKLIGLADGFTFRNPTVSASSITWSSSGSGYTGTPSPNTLRLHAVYHTNVSGSAPSQRVIVPFYATTGAVDTAVYGWTQNTSTGEIYIRLGNINIESTKGNLQFIFDGADARIDGALMFIKNVTFWGMTDFKLRYSQAGGNWNRPILFMENCKIHYSSGRYASAGRLGYGIQNLGGIMVTKGCEFAYAVLDGVNADPDAFAGGGQEPWHVSVDDKYYGNGLQGSRGHAEYLASFPGARNIQGSSYHQGLVAMINAWCADNLGQNIAHTQSTTTGGSWLIGVKCGSPRADRQVNVGGSPTIFPNMNDFDTPYANIHLEGGNVWVDGCSAGGRDTTYGLTLTAGGKVYNSKFDGGTGSISGTATAFNPLTP